MSDRFDVVEVCTRMARHVDQREWDELATVFASEVRLDYTSLNGGDPVILSPAQIAQAWAGVLGGFDATQHLIANHLVDVNGDTAVCTAAFQATHRLANPHGSPLWTLGGNYRFDMTRAGGGWRIAGLVMTATWAEGNQQLMSLAAAKTAAEPPRRQHTTVLHDSISFESDGDILVGNLFRPAEASSLPAVVVTGSWLTVKEQMPDAYARLLAEAGFATLAFDFAGFGASGGEPRDVESPARKSRDIHNAVTFLTQHEAVDANRIGALAICASSGYTAVNAASDPRVRAIAMVAPWLHDAELVEALYGGKDGVAERMNAGLKARARYEETNAVEYVLAASATEPAAAMYGAFDYYLNADRGAIPEWPNRYAVMAWLDWLTYDPIPTADRITVPTLLVHSEDAAIPDGARRFHARLKGPKEFVWLSGTQFDFYDQEPNVTQAISHVSRHFETTLGRR